MCCHVQASEERNNEYVFKSDQGEEGASWFICTERMAKVCPYRMHEPFPKIPSTPHEWFPCDACGKRHRTEQARLTCKATKQFTDALLNEANQALSIGWKAEGSSEPFWSQEIITWTEGRNKNFKNNIRSQLWSWMQWKILERDKKVCQDCGSDAMEVHHIIPFSKGGSDHPSNLKSLCQRCHRKYTDELLGELGPLRAKQNRINKVKEIQKIMPKSLEEFA